MIAGLKSCCSTSRTPCVGKADCGISEAISPPRHQKECASTFAIQARIRSSTASTGLRQRRPAVSPAQHLVNQRSVRVARRSVSITRGCWKAILAKNEQTDTDDMCLSSLLHLLEPKRKPTKVSSPSKTRSCRWVHVRFVHQHALPVCNGTLKSLPRSAELKQNPRLLWYIRCAANGPLHKYCNLIRPFLLPIDAGWGQGPSFRFPRRAVGQCCLVLSPGSTPTCQVQN